VIYPQRKDGTVDKVAADQGVTRFEGVSVYVEEEGL
jgi:hypothetical protein